MNEAVRKSELVGKRVTEADSGQRPEQRCRIAMSASPDLDLFQALGLRSIVTPFAFVSVMRSAARSHAIKPVAASVVVPR